ncbi:hypothetical protein BKA80DRAFT_68752 [Phyllosticta citrichinensis]
MSPWFRTKPSLLRHLRSSRPCTSLQPAPKDPTTCPRMRKHCKCIAAFLLHASALSLAAGDDAIDLLFAAIAAPRIEANSIGCPFLYASRPGSCTEIKSLGSMAEGCPAVQGSQGAPHAPPPVDAPPRQGKARYVSGARTGNNGILTAECWWAKGRACREVQGDHAGSPDMAFRSRRWRMQTGKSTS